MPFELPYPLQFHGIISTIGPMDILDIFIVAVILYKVYVMLQDTRAITLVKGILVLLGVTMVCSWLELHVIYWLLQKTVTLLFVALPIVFQPELRRTLEHLGQGRFFGRSVLLNDEEVRSLVDELDRAVMLLSARKIGALLVLERDMGLNDISATGVQIDGLVSADFLMNVFIPNTPLHDGAAVIRGKRMIAAGCLLPLTENRLAALLLVFTFAIVPPRTNLSGRACDRQYCSLPPKRREIFLWGREGSLFLGKPCQQQEAQNTHRVERAARQNQNACPEQLRG